MKGVYVLIIQINKPIDTKVGALGRVNFEEGFYAYVGSAQNNLELRVARHKKRVKPLHWHIDYLLKSPDAQVIETFYKTAEKTEECRLADLLSLNGEPILGFGCSDCNCQSHLYLTKSYDFLHGYMQHLN